jgi:long-subunit fatty acid transport protein
MSQGYNFPQETQCTGTNCVAPPPTRYDVMVAESTALFPSIAASYRILPGLDVGGRFSAGNAKAKQQVAVWGTTGNVEESVRNDTHATLDVKDGFVPTFGFGLTYRPNRFIELAAVYNSATTLRLKGTAVSVKGPSVDPAKVVGPILDNNVGNRLRCDAEGDFTVGQPGEPSKTPACLTVQLPQNAAIGTRYKFLDSYGRMKGDIEVNLGWENWGKTCKFDSAANIIADKDCASPSQILVNLDAGLYVNDQFTEALQVNAVNLGLQDVYTIRVGGSYIIPLNDGSADKAGWPSSIILRGGIGYDTAAARKGWLRASFDGAARTTATVGAALRTPKWELNLGGGYVYEGVNRNPGASADGSLCNPTRTDPIGCDGVNSRPLDQRQGPDPTNPLFAPEVQFESPFNQGSIKSSYLLFMLGYNRFW